MYDVSVRELQPARLAALRHAGSYLEIGPTFERLFAWAIGRGLMGPADPGDRRLLRRSRRRGRQDLRSDAGLVIGPEVPVDGDLRIVEVPGGRHAVLHHRGPYAELNKAYRWLYREWLPRSGEQCADRPIFEEYLNNPRILPPEQWLTDICLPLARALSKTPGNLPRPALFNFGPQSVIWLTFARAKSIILVQRPKSF